MNLKLTSGYRMSAILQDLVWQFLESILSDLIS